MQDETDRPMFAEITNTDDVTTTVCLSIFGEKMHSKIHGKEHHARAAEWANAWNQHLDQEWMRVRETSATIMRVFTSQLLKQGVCEKVIDTALLRVQADVEG